MKSRQTSLKSEDQNTSFFHKQATARQIRNNITAIIDSSGTQRSEQGTIKSATSDHFKNLLTEIGDEGNYDDLLQHLPTKITSE